MVSTWQTLKKLLLNQNKLIGCETVFREAGSGSLGHQRSWHSDGGVEGRSGSLAGTQRGGSPNQCRVISFSFFLGGMSQPGFCYYREGENGCQGEPQIAAALGPEDSVGESVRHEV